MKHLQLLGGCKNLFSGCWHCYPRVQLPERKKIAVDVSQSLAQHKTEMIIVENTVEAAEHSAKISLLFTKAIPAIEQEAQEDKGEQPRKKKKQP